MPETINLPLNPLQVAVHDRLAEHGIEMVDHYDADKMSFPLVHFGGIEGNQDDDQDNTIHQMEFIVEVWSEKEGYREANKILNQVATALESELVVEGFNVIIYRRGRWSVRTEGGLKVAEHRRVLEMNEIAA